MLHININLPEYNDEQKYFNDESVPNGWQKTFIFLWAIFSATFIHWKIKYLFIIL